MPTDLMRYKVATSSYLVNAGDTRALLHGTLVPVLVDGQFFDGFLTFPSLAASGKKNVCGKHRSQLVGARGFEPPTPCAQGRCATRLRYAPSDLPSPSS